ncbi:MAG: CHAT domain-containing protein [Campylobacterota bacterium]|nr:CHAT domain-containing protein [Campylobacterota bacterium]
MKGEVDIKKLFSVVVTSVVFLLNGCTESKNTQAQNLCEAEAKKDYPDRNNLHKYCIKAAEYHQAKNNFSDASRYYLFSGEFEKNLINMETELNSGSAYSTIAYSYALSNKIEEAEVFYKKFLKNVSIPWADGKINRDYELLVKLYPEQKTNLGVGLNKWKTIYTPFKSLYQQFREALKLKQYKKSIDSLTQIIELQKQFQNNDNMDIWDKKFLLSKLYYYDKEYKKSLFIMHEMESLDKQNIKNFFINYVELFQWLGENYIALGDYNRAITYFEKALKHKETLYEKEVEKDIDFAKINQKLSFLYKKVGDSSNADRHHQQTSDILDIHAKNNREAVLTLSKLGAFKYKRGDLSGAIIHYQDALNIIENTPYRAYREGAERASIFYNLGLLYIETGDLDKALGLMQKALKIRENIFGKEHADTAENYDALGKIYQNLKDFPKAEQYYLKAFSIREKVYGEYNILTAQSYKSLGSFYRSEERYQKSIKYYLKALSVEYNPLRQKIYYSASDTSNQLASVYMLTKDYPQAEKYYRQALLIQEKKHGKNNSKFSSIYNNLGSVFLATGRHKKAYHYAKEAFNIFIKNRDNIFTILKSEQKEKYLKSNTVYITLLLESSYQYIQQLNNQNNLTQAQELLRSTINAWLNYKGSVFDSENAIAMLYASTKDTRLKERIDELVSSKRYLAKLYQSLPKSAEKEAWQNNIKNTEKKIGKLTNEIASKATSFKEQQGLKSSDHKDITSQLKDNELYIDYAKTAENYYLFSLDNKEHIEFIQIDKNSTKRIDNLVKEFREDVNTILNDSNTTDTKLEALTQSSKGKLSKLYELVIQKPLGDTIKDKTSLIISPDGALRLLPFEALYDKVNNKYIIEEKEIRYIPSGKELVRLYRYSKDKVAKSTSVIFANPNFNTKIASLNKEQIAITPNTNRSGIIKSLFRMRFDPLPGTEEEAKAIKATLDQKSILEYQMNKATESTLMQVKEPKILHIATHGFFINDNTIPNPMLKSGIALAGANASAIKGKSDGIVTALKLSGLNLKGTDLVVLSACQTGVVDINSTDSVSGLSKAFIQAGAKDIVMSLWSVDDQATKNLMTSFYQEMNQNKNYAKALKSAKLKMIEEGRHPFYWAAFVVSGL